ncbi:MAG TPA: sigma 54-interacting transcriptional regulator [Terriglobales bacterium]
MLTVPTSQQSRLLPLLEVTRALASHHSLQDLLQDLTQRLHEVLNFTYLSMLLYDSEHDKMRLHTLESLRGTTLERGALIAMEGSASATVWRSQTPLIFSDVPSDDRFPNARQIFLEHGVYSACVLPLTTPRRRLGTITFGSSEANTYREDAIEMPTLIAGQVAIAVENSQNYQAAQEAQQRALRERDRLRLILEVTNAIMSNLSLEELFDKIPKSVRSVLHCDAAFLSLPDATASSLVIHGLDFPTGHGLLQENFAIPVEGTTPGIALRTGTPQRYGTLPAVLSPDMLAVSRAENLQSGCFIPISRQSRKLGVLHLFSRELNAFSQEDVDFLCQLSAQLGIALDNALQFTEVAEARTKLQEEAQYLRQELRSERGFGEILGESAPIRRALSQIQTVAPTDSTVLIQGETGTGKELVARAIHNLSQRRDHTFVKVNCAAIPLGLLESELFGHERGAFTGAISQRIGRFELAHKGTLFLDEIGDIPLELQSKLLRVLQEQEFERLGSTKTIRVNVRLVAATNRDLAKMVEEQTFRADLYYRLNVFPITLAPLRERREDIPLLVYHFVGKFAQRMNKRVDVIPPDTMQALMRYNWPGNIRELQNLIERAVILSHGHTLNVPIAELQSGLPAERRREASEANGGDTLEHAEREHILRVLKDSGWKLAGERGAAARLGMARTTLLYRMKKLGIERPQ